MISQVIDGVNSLLGCEQKEFVRVCWKRKLKKEVGPRAKVLFSF